jgi:biotin operon repressor
MPTTPTSTRDLAMLLKVIADETRLRILGAIADEPLTGKDLAERLDLTPPTISHHMRKLVEAGIAIATSDAQRQWYRLNGDLLLASKRVDLDARGESPPEAGSEVGDDEVEFRQKVLRDFMVDGRLKSIPAQRKRRVVVLQHLTGMFDPNRSYSEREVNDLLKPVHPDFATLRRELVDYGFMTRERGIYQVTRGAPARSRQVRQEITGDENAWLRTLLARATNVSPE